MDTKEELLNMVRSLWVRGLSPAEIEGLLYPMAHEFALTQSERCPENDSLSDEYYSELSIVDEAIQKFLAAL